MSITPPPKITPEELDLQNYENQIKKLLSLKFEYYGKELITKTDEFIKSKIWDKKKTYLIFKKSWNNYNKKMLLVEKKIIKYFITFDFGYNKNIENCLFSESVTPLYKINKSDSPIIKNKILFLDKKKKSSKIFLDQILYVINKFDDLDSLNYFDLENLCLKNPFRQFFWDLEKKLEKKKLGIEQENDFTFIGKVFFDLENFFDIEKSEKMIENIENEFLEKKNKLDNIDHIKIIEKIDKEYYESFKYLLEDKRFLDHNKKKCRNCFLINPEFPKKIEKMSLEEIEEFLINFGDVMPKKLIDGNDEFISLNFFKKYIKGKNPNFP